MKIYTIENDTISERELSEDMGRFKYIDEDGFTVFIKDSNAFQTWAEAHAVLEEQARTNLELQKRRLNMERSKLESVLAMKEPE